MTREEKLAKCVVYKDGEKECPKNVSTLLWKSEYSFVNYSDMNFEEMVDDYCNLFHLEKVGENSGIALEVRALLFAKMCHWCSEYSPDENAKAFARTFDRLYGSYKSGK